MKNLQNYVDTIDETVFFHVAHPTVRCKVLKIDMDSRYNQSAFVTFEKEVKFEGNAMRPEGKEWYCNPKLLFTSPEEALANHDPNWKENRYKDG